VLLRPRFLSSTTFHPTDFHMEAHPYRGLPHVGDRSEEVGNSIKMGETNRTQEYIFHLHQNGWNMSGC